MTFDDAKKDPALFALLKKFMVATLLVEENYEFLTSTAGNQELYTKFIPEGAPMQVNIDATQRRALETLAATGQWGAMGPAMKVARDEVLKMTNMDTMPKFEKSDVYKNHVASKNPKAAPAKPTAAPAKPVAQPKPVAPKAPASPPKPPAPPAKPAANAAPNLAALKSPIAAIEKDITEGTKFYTTAKATLKSKGLPSSRDEVNRMFDSGRMRHDKVHNAFTGLLQKEKAFTRDNCPEVFTKKDAYSKLWAEYRKQLGK